PLAVPRRGCAASCGSACATGQTTRPDGRYGCSGDEARLPRPDRLLRGLARPAWTRSNDRSLPDASANRSLVAPEANANGLSRQAAPFRQTGSRWRVIPPVGPAWGEGLRASPISLSPLGERAGVRG